MKKLIALAFCFILAVSVLTACGENEDKKNTDTTTRPSTAATNPTTKSTAPTSDATQPSTIPDSGFMPDDGGNNGGTNGGNNGSTNGGNSGTGNANGGNGGSGSTNGGTGNGMGGAMDNSTGQSRTHAPSIVGGSR